MAAPTPHPGRAIRAGASTRASAFRAGKALREAAGGTGGRGVLRSARRPTRMRSGAHANAPPAGPVAAQRVHPVPRQVEVAGLLGDLEIGQDTADAWHEVRRQPPRAVPLEERPQALVREFHRVDCIA